MDDREHRSDRETPPGSAVDDLAHLRVEPWGAVGSRAVGAETAARRSRLRARLASVATSRGVRAAVAAGIAAGALAFGTVTVRSSPDARASGGATVRIGVASTTTAPRPPALQSQVPPPKGAPFPASRPAGRIPPGGVLHRSGGPYVARHSIVTRVLDDIGCRIGTSRRADVNVVCARADVAFFARYADAWKLRGAIWAFVPAWGADREIYVVTVWGRVDQPRSAGGAGTHTDVEVTTVLVDATTGRTMMQGGPPLPAAYANQ